MNETRSDAEPVSDRLDRVLRTEPLLERWISNGMLSRGEAELIWLLIDAAEQGRPGRIALPAHSGRLATLTAVALALRRFTHPGTRLPGGPVVLVGAGLIHRDLLRDVSVGAASVADSLRVVRLRRDGQVQGWRSGRARPVSFLDNLLIVSTSVGSPEIESLGPVVIDERSAGNAYAELHAWAVAVGALVHVVASLTPGVGVGGFVADWPLIATEAPRWPAEFRTAWAYRPRVTMRTVSPEPSGLPAARRRLYDAAREGSSRWPEALSNAAALTRQLAGMAAPLAAYDAHTRGTIAIPIAERAERLEATRASDLPPDWRVFAETGWAPLKHEILHSLSELENHNPKADVLGLLVEEMMREKSPVEIWVDSFVHGRALTDHLLSAGFAITSTDFDSQRVRVLRFGESNDGCPAGTSVITGLPAPWHLHQLVAAGFRGSLHLLSYTFELRRIPAALQRAVNADRVEHGLERTRSYRVLLGDVACPLPPPNLECEFSIASGHEAHVADTVEWGADAAEFAGLADDEWLAALPGEGKRPLDPSYGDNAAVLAMLVEPGPSVILVRPHQMVDRVVGGRLRPTLATSLLPGMSILGLQTDGRSFFERLRPHLDRLQGHGTSFWLDRWDEALTEAADRSGGSARLAMAINEAGGTISPAAVAGWPSPYRIGPRDPENVARVGRLADNPIVTHHARRIAAVMRGLRIEHHRLGRGVSRAIRRNAAGDVDAFDAIEERLGIDVSGLLGDVALHTISQLLGAGSASPTAIGKPLSPRRAREVFVPEDHA